MMRLATDFAIRNAISVSIATPVACAMFGAAWPGSCASHVQVDKPRLAPDARIPNLRSND
jgi:hypothetical protein